MAVDSCDADPKISVASIKNPALKIAYIALVHLFINDFSLPQSFCCCCCCCNLMTFYN